MESADAIGPPAVLKQRCRHREASPVQWYHSGPAALNLTVPSLRTTEPSKSMPLVGIHGLEGQIDFTGPRDRTGAGQFFRPQLRPPGHAVLESHDWNLLSCQRLQPSQTNQTSPLALGK